MAISCANCGRGDLMQPDLANYQCLACGSLTNMATGQLVRGDLPNIVATSPSGHPKAGRVASFCWVLLCGIVCKNSRHILDKFVEPLRCVRVCTR